MLMLKTIKLLHSVLTFYWKICVLYCIVHYTCKYMQMSNCVIHFSFVYEEFNTNNVHKIMKIWIVESCLQHPFTWKYSIVTENKTMITIY